MNQIPPNALIALAGTVGVGKSTLTRKLSEVLRFQPAFESVDQNPYLEDYYSDFKKWSFHLQIYFLAERYKQQKRMVESGGGFVQDRSIYEDVGIFAKLQYEKGNMNDRDYSTYTSLFEAMVMSPYFPKPDAIIYLTGSFDAIMSRLYRRGRKMEVQTPISFWEDLYERYQNWIDSFTVCPVLRLDIESYDCRDPKSLQGIVAQLSDRIAEGKSMQSASATGRIN